MEMVDWRMFCEVEEEDTDFMLWWEKGKRRGNEGGWRDVVFYGPCSCLGACLHLEGFSAELVASKLNLRKYWQRRLGEKCFTCWTMMFDRGINDWIKWMRWRFYCQR